MSKLPYWLWRASKTGFDVGTQDRPSGVRCPRPDCDREVVYNGNYFCGCGWALMPDVFDTSKHRGMEEWLQELRAKAASRKAH